MARLQAFAAAERENMVKFTECLSQQLVPYIQYCIHAIFPPAQIAMHLGISVGALQKEVRDRSEIKVREERTNSVMQDDLQEVTYLNKQAILEPVAVLLPIKKNSLVSKLATSNAQPLTSHNAILPLIVAPAPLTEAAVSSSTKTMEKSKETAAPHSKLDVQNSHDSSNDVN